MWLGPLKARPMTQRSGGPAITQGVWGSHRLVATPGAASARLQAPGVPRGRHTPRAPRWPPAQQRGPPQPRFAGQDSAARVLRWALPLPGPHPPTWASLSFSLPHQLPAAARTGDTAPAMTRRALGAGVGAPWDFRPPGPWPLLAGPRRTSAEPWSGRRKGRERASAGPL